MSKNVTFYLGPAIGLSARRLTIHPIMVATDGLTRPAAAHVGNLASTDTYATVSLSDNLLYQATLRDTKSTGETSRVDVLNFHTGSLQFPGPKSGDRLSIYSMEDESSSSSLSSSSISTSSSRSQSSLSSSSKSSSSRSSLSQSSISTSSNSSSKSSQSMSTSSSSSSRSSLSASVSSSSSGV